MNIFLAVYLIYFISMFLWFDLYLINKDARKEYEIMGAGMFVGCLSGYALLMSCIFALFSPYFLICWLIGIIKENKK